MVIQTVLVTASPQLRDAFATVLAEAPEISLVGVAHSVSEVTGLAHETPNLDVVLVDAELSDPPALELVRELSAVVPLIAVAVVGNTATTLAQVVAAGGRDVLVRPLSLQEVRSQLENAAAWSRSLRQHVAGDGARGQGDRGSLITLSGAKGGVGVSVLATVLATVAAARGESVCLVDLDLYAGDLSYLCGVAPRRNVADLAGLVGDVTIRGIREIAVEVPAGFGLLAAPEHAEQAEEVTATAVRQALNELRRHFSVIIVDTGSMLDDPRAVALEVADEAILVADCELISIRAGRRMIDSWARLNIREPETVRLVVNRADKRREVQPDLVAKLLKVPLMRAVPTAVSEIEEPVNAGGLTSARLPVLERVAGEILADCAVGRPTLAAAPTPEAAQRVGRRAKVGARAEAGSAIVELPVFVMVFLMAFLVCAQGLVLGLGHLLAGNAANAVARQMSVNASDRVIHETAENAMGGFTAEPQVRVDRSGHTVTVRVEVPKLYGWLPDGLDTATAQASYVPEDR